jgi:hypothetical protein
MQQSFLTTTLQTASEFCTRHLALDTPLRQFVLEHLPNPRIFVFVFDLISTGFHALGCAPLFSQAGKFSTAKRFER